MLENVTLRMPRDLLARAEAYRRGVCQCPPHYGYSYRPTLAEFIRDAIERHLDKLAIDPGDMEDVACPRR